MGFSPIVGVYLAAGKSSRMGRNKLEFPFRGTFLGSCAFEAALESKLDWTIAVTRRGDPFHWLGPFVHKQGWSMLQCDDADNGQSASLKAGVRAAMALSAEAVVVLLADQPLVSKDILNRLLDAYCEPFTASAKNGVIMPPIAISSRLFQGIMELSGDKGARTLLRSIEKQGKLLEFGSALADVDTEEDYENLLKVGREENWVSSAKA